jgi:hypothetical protein
MARRKKDWLACSSFDAETRLEYCCSPTRDSLGELPVLLYSRYCGGRMCAFASFPNFTKHLQSLEWAVASLLRWPLFNFAFGTTGRSGLKLYKVD